MLPFFDSSYDRKTGKWVQGPVFGLDNYLLDFIVVHLNITYVLVENRQTDLGVQLQNGSYTGLLRGFERGEIDIMFGDASLIQKSSDVVEPAMSHFQFPITFITSKPDP